MAEKLEVDYLVVGGGAAGLVFDDKDVMSELTRYLSNIGPAVRKLPELARQVGV